jgi:MFS family permease
MLWSPNVWVLLAARLVDGVGVGLAVTTSPLYISEVSPAEIRGELNMLPQLLGTLGVFLAYVMVFFLSLTDDPSWRLMLAAMSLPSAAYLAVALFFLPESPRWLVSKGRTRDAKRVLQCLRDCDDVSGPQKSPA